MKVGILTFHRAANYGAVLQSYALVQALRLYGCNAEIIDYRCKFIEDYYNPKMLLLPKNWKRLIYYILFNGVIIPHRENYYSFLLQNNVLSEQVYKSQNELKGNEYYYDSIIAGSDQVWNYATAGFDKVYFLKFVADSCKKKSYAASFGISKIPDNIKEEYRSLLSSFSNISVRETSGKAIVEDLLNREASVDLDPTLLLDDKKWKKVIKNVRPEIMNLDKYLLVYAISENQNLLKIANIIAKEKQLNVVYINNRWRKNPGVLNISYASVDEWLYLFSKATFVVTDSFHGTAFSINFDIPFCTYQANSTKIGSRIDSLLSILELKNRIVVKDDSGFNSKLFDSTLYIKPNRCFELSILRAKSIANLKKIMGEE